MYNPKEIDTLVIIGNGFDIWQGLDTSYDSFYDFYHKHLDEVLNKLHIKKWEIVDEEGNKEYFTDIDLIYGNPLDPGELNKSFWTNFESSLANIDTYNLQLFFGNDKDDLKDMKRSVNNASRILKEMFYLWISSIKIDGKEERYHFKDNCVFINFNYTKTLTKRFNIDSNKEYHIHGSVDDKKSIIFGHNKHPQAPEEFLDKLNGNFRGLYLIDKVLFETDKHCTDNILDLSLYLDLIGIRENQIKDVYVLGHSMGKVDYEYFEFLKEATTVNNNYEEDIDISNINIQEDLDKRIEYTIDTLNNKEPSKKAIKAMNNKLLLQNKYMNDMYKDLIREELNVDIDNIKIENNRTKDAKWHISYYGDIDKKRKLKILKMLGITNYELLPSIDDCLMSM